MEDQAKTASEELSKAIESLTNAVKLLPSSSDNTKIVEKLLEETIELQKKNDKKLLIIENIGGVVVSYNDEIINKQLGICVSKDQIITLLIRTLDCSKIIQYDFKDLPFADTGSNTLSIFKYCIMFNSKFITHIADPRSLAHGVDKPKNLSIMDILNDFTFISIQHNTNNEELLVNPIVVKFIINTEKTFRIDGCCIKPGTFTQKFYTNRCDINMYTAKIQLFIVPDMVITITDDDILINNVKLTCYPEYYFLNRGDTKHVKISTFKTLKPPVANLF